MKRLLVGLVFSLFAFACAETKVMQYADLEKNNLYIKHEILVYQIDGYINKSEIENVSVLKGWINDSTFVQGSISNPSIKDTFSFLSDGAFVKRINSENMIIFRHGSDSIIAWNLQFSSPIQLLDSFKVDYNQSAFLLRQYGTVDIENSYGHPREVELIYSDSIGIVGYKRDGPWGRKVFRLVKRTTYYEEAERTEYYNFNIPKSWEYDIYYIDPRKK